MTLTPQELARKRKARKLVGLPVAQRPDNVLYQPEGRFDYAAYQVIFDDIAVCFQYDGKRFYYLGEYPAENFIKTRKPTELRRIADIPTTEIQIGDLIVGLEDAGPVVSVDIVPVKVPNHPKAASLAQDVIVGFGDDRPGRLPAAL